MTQRWNRCVSCDNQIPKNRPGFAGYSVDKTPLLVGACCAHLLEELATPVYWSGALDLSVSDNQTVWRYMDFAKLVSMLQLRGLYFSRADLLGDPFEGAIGLLRKEHDWDEHHLNYFRQVVVSRPPGFPEPNFSQEEIELEAKRLLGHLKSVSSDVRNLLVSCWHANDSESEALWRLYCPPPTIGIAIRTTVGRLWEATEQEASAIVGQVQYLDFRHAFATIQDERIFCKRQSLSHESEVRVVLHNHFYNPTAGKTLECDLSSLIEEIRISPFSPSWVLDVVKATIERFGFTFDVAASDLLEEPFY